MFRLLGPLEVSVDGRPVDPGAPKPRAVLAALLLEARSVVPVERLVDAVWEGEPPRTAQHSIQVYVGDLRKRLAEAGLDARIETLRTGYLLDPASQTVDVEVFETEARAGIRALDGGDPEGALLHLERALRVWREPPLEDFAYAEFAQPAIRRLRSLRHDVARSRAVALLQTGGARQAVADLRDLFEEDPLDGEAARLLMLATRDSGNRVEALRAYETHRRALAAELGIEPGADVDRAYESVLAEPPPSGPVRRNPFKGLRPFGEGDAADFHGRSGEVSEILGKLESGEGLVAVVGPSGCGKSSIVRAGLLPALRDAAAAGAALASIVTMAPGRHPLSDPALTEVGHRSGRRAVLIVDQFEELYTLVGVEERDAFVDTVRELAAGGVQVVAVLRADFYDRVLADLRLAGAFSANAVDVLPLDPPRLEEAAREPAREAGLRLEDELVVELVAATARRPGSLPLFEYVLTELADRAEAGILTMEAYRAMGGVEGTLGRQADALYERLAAPERRAVRQILLRLTAEAGDPPTRRRVTLAELSALALDPDVLDRALDALGRARLVTFGRDPGGGPAVEVAHESLLAEWERLAGWIEAARADLVRRRSLEAAIGEWRRAGRDPDYLPSGSRLVDLERWAGSTDLVLADEERSFLEEARLREDDRRAAQAVAEQERQGLSRRARRRLWAAVAGVSGLAAVGTFLLLAWLLAPGPPDVAVLVMSGDLDPDTVFGSLIHAGVERAEADLGVDVLLVPVDAEDAGERLAELAADGVGLFVHAYTVAVEGVARAELAPAGPRQVSLDVPMEDPDGSSIVFAAEEGSFLVGVAAGETTRTGVVGFVGGMESELIFAFEAGFAAGVRAVDPSIEVVTVYLAPCPDFSGFGSPTLGVLGAEAVMDRGADIVYTAAGESGIGVHGAVSWRSDERTRRWAIGVDRDMYAEFDEAIGAGGEETPGVDLISVRDHVLTSMVKRFDVAVYRAIAGWVDGGLEPGVEVLGLEEGAVGYATSGGFVDHLAPELEAWRERIVAGEVEVPDTLPSREGWECRIHLPELAGP